MKFALMFKAALSGSILNSKAQTKWRERLVLLELRITVELSKQLLLPTQSI
uniref:Uncharacterized protein n=1 Tax=Rhizophora mucronata TaxID=61149 RepID=A0A2P2NQH4_RHIMU